jgi:hypothetical protein
MLGAKSRSAARRKAALADKEDRKDPDRLLVPSRRFSFAEGVKSYASIVYF